LSNSTPLPFSPHRYTLHAKNAAFWGANETGTAFAYWMFAAQAALATFNNL
jgi:hypothetical protein